MNGDRSEHGWPHTPRTALVIAVAVLVVIGLIYVYSSGARSSPTPSGTSAISPEEQAVLDTLQSTSTTSADPSAPTAAQIKALGTLGTTGTGTKQSANTPAQERSILDSLQSR